MLFALPGNEVTAAGFLTAGIVVFGVTGIFVIIRLINSFGYSKHLYADDYLAVFAWALQAVNFGVYIKLLLNIADTTISVRDFTQFLIAEAIIGGFSIYFAKVPVFVLYARLFGIRKWLRITVWTTLGVSFFIFLGSLLYVSVECSAGKVHDQLTELGCINAGGRNGLVHGVASLALDLIAFSLPLPIVFHLQLSTNKKIGLSIVFTAGIFAIVASTIALSYKVQVATGIAVSNLGTTSIILSFLEASIAIIVGCVPALRSFWINQFSTSPIYSKLRSLFSTRTSSSSKLSQDSLGKQSSGSTDGIIQANYIELQESSSTHAPGGYASHPLQH
ncbi:hypothetical protein ONZ43_g862 [Nemania bipapillata]|uniref:Uncharacterized protein n=1 Tax=Nemania bipapillata TaxID=110536 RepID=A0ACC2J6K5_9PEZI|nr:hypothetical protein ONZ43_g862 [Nemania bipapillata]